jgi:AraC-like DNA-binding protein
MVDPLAEVVTLLQPRAPFSKVVSAAGAWRVRRTQASSPFYCVIVDGSCLLTVSGREPITLKPGDFALVPSAFSFAMSSLQPPPADELDVAPVEIRLGEFELGKRGGQRDVLFLVGHCVFGSPDAALLVSLLPQVVHVRGEKRLATLVRLVGEEARDFIMERLLEVLLIEALRSTASTDASPGLLQGLADERLAAAIRQMHENPDRLWTVAELAKEAALSRSSFFERFSRLVGVAPMEYLLAWRMALAKSLLRKDEAGVAEVASRVGYSSASTFSVAFIRFVGVPPWRYARDKMDAAEAETATTTDGQSLLLAEFA